MGFAILRSSFPSCCRRWGIPTISGFDRLPHRSNTGRRLEVLNPSSQKISKRVVYLDMLAEVTRNDHQDPFQRGNWMDIPLLL